MRARVASFAVVLLLAPVWALAAGNRSLLVANRYSQAIQNARANAYGLTRMRNTAMIQQFQRVGYLVPVSSSTRFYYLQAVPPAYRYLRPWAKLFLARLSREYCARFGQRLRVTSLVRTVASQVRLGRMNPNAAEATGPDRSAHLTGAALDISKRFMSADGVSWMRNALLGLKRAGCLYAIEEFEEPNFHIMVYPTYREYVARLEGRPSGAEQARLHISAEATDDR